MTIRFTDHDSLCWYIVTVCVSIVGFLPVITMIIYHNRSTVHMCRYIVIHGGFLRNIVYRILYITVYHVYCRLQMIYYYSILYNMIYHIY